MILAKVKDIKNRKQFFKKEFFNKKIKFLFINLLNKNKHLQQNSKQLDFFLKLKQKNSKTKIIRRCIFNNRSRGSLRFLGVSRIYLRELLQFGVIPGYKKAVW
jgi:ribosomal protein S14